MEPLTLLRLPQLTWLVTGCSSGFGEQFVHAVIARGDRVIATARNSCERLQYAKDAGAAVLDLDLTATQGELDAKVKEAIAIYGGIDVLVNNAGFIESCFFEEASHEALLNQFNTNVFGTVALTRSVLAHFRQKRSGVFAFIGSVGGWVGNPAATLYSGSKFALEGVVECLQEETSHMGIQSVIFEPGLYRTKIFSAKNMKSHACHIPAYAEISQALAGYLAATDDKQPGDPRKLVERIIDVIKSEGMASGKAIPPRLPMGRDALANIKAKCEATLKLCEEWELLITSTDF